MPIDQHVKPWRIEARMKRLSVPQTALAEYADLSTPLISLWFAGERGLSLDAQLAVLRAMEFFEEVAASTDVPVDFGNEEGLRPRWRKFLRLRAEREVIRTAGELAASEVETT